MHILRTISFLAATFSLALFIYGLLLRTTLHNGNECDMTWSVVRFILLPPPNPHLPYRLLKFTDGRDSRYEHLVNYDQPSVNDDKTYDVVRGKNWCTPSNPSRTPGHIVLYVPGHEGNYMQARSLGAHGTTLTLNNKDESQQKKQNIINQLWDGTKNGTAAEEENFVYDVYTVDFNGEGGGLHGSKLFAQAEFVATSIQRIAHECEEVYDGKITVVAHSIGGLVARKAIVSLNQRNTIESLVETLVTLATPHSSLALIVEPSVFAFRKELLRQERNSEARGLRIVSISGGMRDELIPPSACHLGTGNSLSVLASDITNTRREKLLEVPRLGVDHKAIVWCHHLQCFVRKVIHAAARQRENLLDETLLEFQSQDNGNILKSEYGELGNFVIKTSMIYNCRLLATLYLLNSVTHGQCRRFCNDSVSDHTLYIAIPLLSSLAAMLVSGKDSIDFGSILVLAYNAMSLYYIILHGILSGFSWTLKRYVHGDTGMAKGSIRRTFEDYLKYQLSMFTVLAFLSSAALQIFSFFRKDALVLNTISCGALCFLLFVQISAISIISLIYSPHDDTVRKSAASTTLIFFPLSVIGKVVYALSLLTHQGQAKALPYMEFQQRCSEFMCTTAGSSVLDQLLKSDLLTYTIVVCIPMNLLMARMFCINNNSARIDGKKDS